MTKKKKTTMSVPEMQRLLGLGKTDAYWLLDFIVEVAQNRHILRLR